MDSKVEQKPVYAEHLDGGTLAPRVMLRKGDLKIVQSTAYPTQIFNLVDDADELTNLADDPDWLETTGKMIDSVNAVWNLDQLRNEVIASQQVRQLLVSSLGKGQKRNWEHYPNPQRDATKWVREGDYFPEVEQRGYLDYPVE